MTDRTVVDTPAQALAVLHVTVPRAGIREVMGPGLQELRAEVDAQGVVVTGPWFTHHLRLDPEVFDLEIGLPVAAPVQARGRVRPSVRPALTVARTVHAGGYEGLGDAWGAFLGRLATQDLLQAGDLWETYAVGPEAGADPAGWRTVLERPIVRRAGPADDLEVVHGRVLDASPARVFEAIRDPAQLARWWGPDGFTNTFEAFDLRPGGAWRLVMHGPDGTHYPNESVFREVVPGVRVVIEHVSAPAFFLTITLDDEGGRTRVGWRQRFDAVAARERLEGFVRPANEQNLGRLAAVVAG